MRQFYCMCTLLYCTNNQCCMPVVKANGGSSELIKILNRLGAITSEDTHSRHVTCVSLERESEIKSELTPNAFRVASIDNVDVLSAHASAHAGKANPAISGTVCRTKAQVTCPTAI